MGAGLRLNAAGLAGSAAHPDSLEPENNAGASAPSDATCSCRYWSERPARLPKKRGRTLEGSANLIHCLHQWRGRGLSSARWRLLIFLADPECARGKQKTPSPDDFNRRSAASAPAHLAGVLRGVPAEGVAGDSTAAPAQGKAFPKNI